MQGKEYSQTQGDSSSTTGGERKSQRDRSWLSWSWQVCSQQKLRMVRKGTLGSWNNGQKLKTKNEQTNKIKTIVLLALQLLLRALGRSQQLPVGMDGLSGLHRQIFTGQWCTYSLKTWAHSSEWGVTRLTEGNFPPGLKELWKAEFVLKFSRDVMFLRHWFGILRECCQNTI